MAFGIPLLRWLQALALFLTFQVSFHPFALPIFDDFSTEQPQLTASANAKASSRINILIDNANVSRTMDIGTVGGTNISAWVENSKFRGEFRGNGHCNLTYEGLSSVSILKNDFKGFRLNGFEADFN